MNAPTRISKRKRAELAAHFRRAERIAKGAGKAEGASPREFEAIEARIQREHIQMLRALERAA